MGAINHHEQCMPNLSCLLLIWEAYDFFISSILIFSIGYAQLSSIDPMNWSFFFEIKNILHIVYAYDAS